MAEHLRELLEQPRYGFAEADRLATASRGTTKRWLEGYEPPAGRNRLPVVVPTRAVGGAVSFLGLVEVVAIARLREQGFALGRIRETVKYCRQELDVDRPLASLEFKTGGRQIFISYGAQLLEVGKKKGEFAWNEVLEPFLTTLDYSKEIRLATRWWPLGKEKPIVIDPAFGFGRPVVEGSGVRTEILLERFKAGDNTDQIAEDFSIEPREVERALQFELQRAA